MVSGAQMEICNIGDKKISIRTNSNGEVFWEDPDTINGKIIEGTLAIDTPGFERTWDISFYDGNPEHRGIFEQADNVKTLDKIPISPHRMKHNHLVILFRSPEKKDVNVDLTFTINLHCK
jgi:hypothetical protein